MKTIILSFSFAAMLCLVASVKTYGGDPGKSVPIADHYPGGLDSLLNDIQKELQYPITAKRNRRQGTVQVSLTLMPDGTTKNFRVVHDIGAGCGAEAMRIVKTLKFNAPGYQSNYSIPVKFSL